MSQLPACIIRITTPYVGSIHGTTNMAVLLRNSFQDPRRGTFYYLSRLQLMKQFWITFFLWGYPEVLIKKYSGFFYLPLFRAVKNLAFYQGFKNKT